ncbi:transposase [Aliarcobacter cryaerophilus]|uniref:transposase n=1 Tax=Aliarcobacter cryaerophilus TaxID=28198 RepID=UPI0021B1A5AC|nr:transposase [Aliarcobacter cryaerophilus]MCT7544517.1 transposase [Aliarcobacter cryaerophilus]
MEQDRLKEVLKQRYGLIVSRRKLQRTLKYLNLKVKMKRRFKVITTTSYKVLTDQFLGLPNADTES